MADEAKTETRKPDVTLSDGRAIYFDLTQATYGQVLGIASPTETAEESAQTLANLAGMTLKEVLALNGRDFKKLISAWWRVWKAPLDDPNA